MSFKDTSASDDSPKKDNREVFSTKKIKQKQAKERRQFIRDLKEDRDWN